MPQLNIKEIIRFMPVGNSCHKTYGEMDAYQDGLFAGCELTDMDWATEIKEKLREHAGQVIAEELADKVADELFEYFEENLETARKHREESDRMTEEFIAKQIRDENGRIKVARPE